MTPRRPLACFILLLSSSPSFGQPSPEMAPPPVSIPEFENRNPVQPGVTPFVVPQAPRPSGPPLPAAPPAPTLTMLVLVPQDAQPNQPIPYTIQVTNNSQADASKVKVRMPLPEGTQLSASEPQPVDATAKELVWDLKTLSRGETQKIEVKLKAVGSVSDITVKAYVSYEFGQAVKTRLSAARLKVKTELPKEVTTADEMIPVRVRVTNDGRVAVTNVKLTETISEGFEFHRDSEGDRTNNPLVRTWDLGTVPAGMGKTVEFRVTAKAGRELMVRSNVDASGGLQNSDDVKVKVVDAKLKVELRGDPAASDDKANFKATVKNEGSTTLYNVAVRGTVPLDCKVTSRTNGGQINRDQVIWVIPRLTPGDAYLFKWELKSQAAGRKSVRVEASNDRGLKDAMDVQTMFAGTAALTWEQKFEQATVTVDRTGMFTVKLTNGGSEIAKGAKLVVTLPDNVSFVQATPAHKKEGDKLIFEPRDVRAGGTEVFSITFRGERTGAAYFNAKLTAESIGDKPMSAKKYVQITSGR